MTCSLSTPLRNLHGWPNTTSTAVTTREARGSNCIINLSFSLSFVKIPWEWQNPQHRLRTELSFEFSWVLERTINRNGKLISDWRSFFCPQSWVSLYCPQHLQTALSSVLQTWWCFTRTYDLPRLLLRCFSTVICVGEEVHQAKAWRYVLSLTREHGNRTSLGTGLLGAFRPCPSKTFIYLLLTLFWNGRWNPVNHEQVIWSRQHIWALNCSWDQSYWQINTLIVIKSYLCMNRAN